MLRLFHFTWTMEAHVIGNLWLVFYIPAYGPDNHKFPENSISVRSSSHLHFSFQCVAILWRIQQGYTSFQYGHCKPNTSQVGTLNSPTTTYHSY